MPPSARLKAYYFAHYAMVGATLPFFTPYLRGIGFSGSQIGTVQMVGSLAAAPAALLWAAFADRTGGTARTLRVVVALAFVNLAWLPFARTVTAVAAILLVQGLVASAIVPLVNSVAVETVRATPGGSYARIRLYGSLGYMAAAQGLGLWLAARAARPGDPLVPWAIVALSGACALVALGVPETGVGRARARLSDARDVLTSPALLLLLLACFVHSGASACYFQLFGLLVQGQGLLPSVTGLAMALGVLAEVGAFTLFPTLERRFARSTLLLCAFAGSAIRWALLSVAHGPVSLVAIQALHACTFGLFWASAIPEVRRLVPERMGTTGQALFAALAVSLGSGAGQRLSGIAYDRLGGAGPVYGRAAVVEIAAIALALGYRSLSRRGPPTLVPGA